jgi:predicted Zn-dependent protease
LNGQNECESHVLRFDNSYFDSTTTTNKRGLACHETGHSVGLTHRNTDSKCMQDSGPYPDSLSNHDELELSNGYN